MDRQQQNGNSQLNSERESFNRRINNKRFLGASFRVKLNNRRNYRTI